MEPTDGWWWSFWVMETQSKLGLKERIARTEKLSLYYSFFSEPCPITRIDPLIMMMIQTKWLKNDLTKLQLVLNIINVN